MIQDELELKSRSFIVEITVVQGLVSFNITSIQFGVLQLQQKFLTHFPKTYKIEVLSKSYNQQAFQLFGIIFIHTQLDFSFIITEIMKHSWVCGRCMPKKTYVPFNWNPTLSPKRGGSGFIWRYTSLREQVIELTITSILRTNSVPVLKSTSNMNSYGDMESCRLPTCNLNVSQGPSCFSPVVGRLWRITLFS